MYGDSIRVCFSRFWPKERDRLGVLRTMLYVVAIVLLGILLTSEMSRELLMSHVAQLLDMAPWFLIFGGLFIFLFVILA